MPKSYSEKEKRQIIADLREAAFDSMAHNGVRRTTVDELVKKARIPKGTFYLLYGSKELLLYDALMHKQEEIHAELSETLTTLRSGYSPDTLTETLYGLFQKGFDMGIVPLMTSGELEILVRKLPDKVIRQHIASDNESLAAFRALFPGLTDAKLTQYSAAFRAIFCTVSSRCEIGSEYDAALRLLIRGLVLQMDEENRINKERGHK